MKKTDIEKYLKLLETTQFDSSKPAPPDKTVFRIQFNDIGSLGNIVTFSGRPKAGKSRYLAAAIAAAISKQEIWQLSIKLPPGKEEVRYFDTEQGPKEHHSMVELIKKLADVDILEDANCYTHRCRGKSPVEIMYMVEALLHTRPGIGIIILDGILEVIENMNDITASSRLKQKFFRLTEEFDILILGVIHRGFANDKSIGSIGSDLERASQSVLKVEKDNRFKPSHYVLTGEMLRSCDRIEPIAITYSLQLCLFHEVDYIPEEETGVFKKTKRQPQDYTIDEHTANVLHCFNSSHVHTWESLVREVKEVYGGPGEAWCKECIRHLTWDLRLIFKTADGKYTNVQQGKLKLVN